MSETKEDRAAEAFNNGETQSLRKEYRFRNDGMADKEKGITEGWVYWKYGRVFEL